MYMEIIANLKMFLQGTCNIVHELHMVFRIPVLQCFQQQHRIGDPAGNVFIALSLTYIMCTALKFTVLHVEGYRRKAEIHVCTLHQSLLFHQGGHT